MRARKPNVRDGYCAEASYIRDLIEQAGLSQQEVARRLDLHPRTVRSYVSTNEGRYRVAPFLFVFALESLAQ